MGPPSLVAVDAGVLRIHRRGDCARAGRGRVPSSAPPRCALDRQRVEPLRLLSLRSSPPRARRAAHDGECTTAPQLQRQGVPLAPVLKCAGAEAGIAPASPRGIASRWRTAIPAMTPGRRLGGRDQMQCADPPRPRGLKAVRALLRLDDGPCGRGREPARLGPHAGLFMSRAPPVVLHRAAHSACGRSVTPFLPEVPLPRRRSSRRGGTRATGRFSLLLGGVRA